MTTAWSAGRWPCRHVSRPGRSVRPAARRASTQSTEGPPSPAKLTAASRTGLEIDEDPSSGSDHLFTELMRIAEKQKKIVKAEEEKKHSKAPQKAFTELDVLEHVDIDETSLDRAPFHNQLFLAAKDGNATRAEEVIREMIAEGLQPGPRAYHALVFAHVKAGSASGALTAIRRAHASGARPLTESYAVLIYAFLKEDNIKNAEAVFTSMLRPNANADAEKGWVMLVTMLFRQGFESKALTYLEEGRNESFVPDAYLYRRLIDYHCQNNAYEQALEELGEVLAFERQGTSGICCENGHVKGLLEHYASEGDVLMMLWLLFLPKSRSMRMCNTVLHSLLQAWDREDFKTSDVFEYVWSSIEASSELAMDADALLHFTEAELKRGRAMNARKIFLENQLGEVRGSRLREHVRRLLAPLLRGLCQSGYPISAHSLLLVLSISSTMIPDEALEPDHEGRTFVSQWLMTRLPSLARVPKENEQTSDSNGDSMIRTADGGLVRLVNGIKLGFANCAVDDEGMIMPLSKMKVDGLRAECTARGLSASGTRPFLQKALKKARSSNPAIADEVQRVRALHRARRKMLKERDAETAKQMTSATAVVKYKRIEYRNGKLVSEEEVSAEEAEALLARPQPPPVEEQDIEDWEEDEEKIVELMKPGAAKKLTQKWSDEIALSSREKADMGTDETAGATAAAAIAEMVWKLGGFPTLEDFEGIMKVNEVQKSPVVAWKVGNLIHKNRAVFRATETDADKEGEEYESRVMKILNVIDKMREYDREPEAAVLKELAELKAGGQPSDVERELAEQNGRQVEGVKHLMPAEILREEDEPQIIEEESPITASSSEDEESLAGFGGIERLRSVNMEDEEEETDPIQEGRDLDDDLYGLDESMDENDDTAMDL